MKVRLLVLALYALVLLGIGVYSTRRANSYSGYNLAGRANNKWIGGISTQSSSTSGWMLLAMPGLAYSMGFSAVWFLVGWLGGSIITWVLLARHLRIATEVYGADSCVEYFEKRTGDKRGWIGITSAVIILVLMCVNSSSELVGCGKLINAVFGIQYQTGVIIGLILVAAYTFLGGYLAVSWTNLLQGTLMFIALAVVPFVALANTDGITAVVETLYHSDINYFQFLGGAGSPAEIIALLSGGLGIALMYPGMVHSLTGIIAIKDPEEVKDSGLIAIIWGSVALLGASGIGFVGRVLFPGVEDTEYVSLYMTEDLFGNALFGLFGAAVMAAILSSVCAYIIVATSGLAGSILKRVYHDDEKRIVIWERVLVVVIALTACAIAFRGGRIHTLTMFASSGLGAAFGPIVIASLFTDRINYKGALACIIAGFATVIIWFMSGLSAIVFEAFPGWIVSTTALFVVSALTGGANHEITEGYMRYRKALKTDRREAA